MYNNKPSDTFNTTLWKNDYGTFFDFDTHCFFHKTFKSQLDEMRIYISELLDQL